MWWCTEDMGLLDDDIYVTSTSGLRGYKRKNAWREGLPRDFKCRAHRAELVPSSVQDGEEGDMVQDLIEAIASMEEVLPPKMPFRFGRTSQLPSVRSVSSEHQWDHSITPEDRRCCCIQVRVMLGDRGGNQPHCPMHGEDAWSLTYYSRPGQKTG